MNSALQTPPEHPEGNEVLPVVVTMAPTPPESPAIQDIQDFISATGGNLPYPTTREAFAALPKTTRELLRNAAPGLYQRLGAREESLPAALQLKVMQGATDFDESELQALQTAGYAELVVQARIASRQQIEAAWLAGHEARAASRIANAAAEAAASLAERERLSANVAAEARARFLSGRR
ncbi:hypothetical protein [Cyanobium sp. N5-Cardenillas]|uniref:hypothetical protein n=1 Tax=Cyanobium sp. N5-Cardenillas TaxID=2823720 RepID=UPI0020CD3A44|nr:hypothetical protein [Cyanobium sp. N5-Cardenillas]MCP9786010.1 hypothetical protein [Cyanobium sp. N5-Cardenillas]